MRHLLSVVALALIAGCADQPAAPANVASAAATPAAPAASGVSCHKEQVIGSNFMQTVCTSTTTTHDAATEASLRDMQRLGTQQRQMAH